MDRHFQFHFQGMQESLEETMETVIVKGCVSLVTSALLKDKIKF